MISSVVNAPIAASSRVVVRHWACSFTVRRRFMAWQLAAISRIGIWRLLDWRRLNHHPGQLPYLIAVVIAGLFALYKIWRDFSTASASELHHQTGAPS